MIENTANDGFGWVWWTFIILAFAFVIWLFIKAFQVPGSANYIKKETDLEILEGRFKRGELDEAEYKRRKADLVGKKI